MKTEFASLSIPPRRRLQILAVLQWIFSFLALAYCCLALFVLLLLSDLWYLGLLYLAWLCLDRGTPASGGRRSEWVRNWIIWKYFRDYFPITLVKTAELDPAQNYVFGFHPHGILVAGAFGNFCTEATGFSKLFPGLRPHLLMLPLWFKVPLFRDYIMSAGLVSSEKDSAVHLLSQQTGGQVAVITVGASPEALEARPGSLTLHILHRKGFIKVAMSQGAQLVPVFSFGETDLFHQVENPPGSFIRLVQEMQLKIMGAAVPLFYSQRVLQYSFGLMPFRRPIHTVVGQPIPVMKNPNPSMEEIEALHKTYLQSLIQLFEMHKTQYGIEEHQHLNLV